ncbi:hypothetical protein LTR70_008083 [Exophiala xenobiotica]|uniref:Uncharacterized protein n=1 Tax=Lithohypha guttulata TaxID=1690604 RepID=A0ABR0K3V8_9EURO|nr:hypothetical protein LTR24_007200 [Lithohypha guttulata]KAK5312640.1 hypothetical protein LTR70_008083 [Exophiala xenobiotica]
MSRPVHMSSGSYFRETLRDYPTVFAMFYKCSDLSTRAMLPIFEFLCEEHTTTRVAFVMVKKDDLPGLCVEHRIPRSTNLTFAAFKNERKVGMTDDTFDQRLLAQQLLAQQPSAQEVVNRLHATAAITELEPAHAVQGLTTESPDLNEQHDRPADTESRLPSTGPIVAVRRAMQHFQQTLLMWIAEGHFLSSGRWRWNT